MSKIKLVDKEYSCYWTKECSYLMEHGFRYTFVKTDENNITVWKFKKTKELFKALYEFYEKEELRKTRNLGGVKNEK